MVNKAVREKMPTFQIDIRHAGDGRIRPVSSPGNKKSSFSGDRQICFDAYFSKMVAFTVTGLF